jgi:hypothetical protein
VDGICDTNGGEEENVLVIGRKAKTEAVDNIKMDLEEIRLADVDWIRVDLDRDNELSGSIKCWETIEWLHNLWALEQC